MTPIIDRAGPDGRRPLRRNRPHAIVDAGRLDAQHAAAAGFLLEDQGFCILRSLAERALVGRIAAELEADFGRTPQCRGAIYGERTRRFGRLLARSPSVAGLVLHPVLLGLVERILGPWCDCVQLNVAQAIEVGPGARAQLPHRDQDMWRGTGRFEHLINVIWPLTRFTADNGATLLWPDTHGSTALDADAREPDVDDAVTALADPGDAIVFLGSTLHGAGANQSGAGRRAIVIGYSLGWLRAYENQSLAYPPDVARGFSPELQALVGYRQHRPNLGNFEGQCPSVLLGGWQGEALPAIDALRPEQTEAVQLHAARQGRSVVAANGSGSAR